MNLNNLSVQAVQGTDLLSIVFNLVSGISPAEVGVLVGIVSLFMLAKKGDFFITLIQMLCIIGFGLILFGIINV